MGHFRSHLDSLGKERVHTRRRTATSSTQDGFMSVNLMSVIYGIRTFVPRMLAHGEPGHVVNTCSMTSVIAATNMYGICKHAILALTEVLAADLAAAGAPIGATGLCPGIIATNLFHGSRNRPAALTDGAVMSSSGAELRDHMHSVLSGDAAVGGGGPAG